MGGRYLKYRPPPVGVLGAVRPRLSACRKDAPAPLHAVARRSAPRLPTPERQLISSMDPSMLLRSHASTREDERYHGGRRTRRGHKLAAAGRSWLLRSYEAAGGRLASISSTCTKACPRVATRTPQQCKMFLTEAMTRLQNAHYPALVLTGGVHHHCIAIPGRPSYPAIKLPRLPDADDQLHRHPNYAVKLGSDGAKGGRCLKYRPPSDGIWFTVHPGHRNDTSLLQFVNRRSRAALLLSVGAGRKTWTGSRPRPGMEAISIALRHHRRARRHEATTGTWPPSHRRPPRRARTRNGAIGTYVARLSGTGMEDEIVSRRQDLRGGRVQPRRERSAALNSFDELIVGKKKGDATSD